MPTLIVGGLLLLCVVLALRHVIRTKKAGGCVGCPGGGACAHCHAHQPPEDTTKTPHE